MRTGFEYFAIKNNKIICGFDVAPVTKQNLQRFCDRNDFDTWIHLDKKGALSLFSMR